MKKDKQEEIETVDLVELMNEMDDLSINVTTSEIPVVVPEGNIIKDDDTTWKVRSLRLQGFDDNRIAAILMVPKLTIQGIK